jgi:hypothetical protein
MSRMNLGRSLVFVGALVASASLAAVSAGAQAFATPSETTPGTVDVPAYPATGTTTPAQPVSMRAGPNTSFPVIGTLRPGMPLQILASANYGWMQVQSPVGTGWVYGSYLASGMGGVPGPTANTQPAPTSNNSPRPEISSP